MPPETRPAGRVSPECSSIQTIESPPPTAFVCVGVCVCVPVKRRVLKESRGGKGSEGAGEW